MASARAVMRTCRTAVDVGRNLIGWHESEAKLSRDAQQYWESTQAPGRREAFAHWRGFCDDATWLAIGRESLATFDRLAGAAGFDGRLDKVVEWGCGGGANAMHFGPRAGRFVGVDVTRESLDECGKQLASIGLGDRFDRVQIDVATPETALDAIGPGSCDAFVSFYVFELFPTPEYGARVLSVARKLLRPGGYALVHAKYETGLATRSRRWGYKLGVANMTSYRIDEFWQMAERCGFSPGAVSLMPHQPLVNDERYAYFALRAH